ncbi:MAG: ribonuclease HII [Deltaproteobacteria bacterium]|nr:ribonuclease HII [Deltaproteobacteria bacterium]
MHQASWKALLQKDLEYYAHGWLRIAGVDEVGRGCLAGPVFAAAVVLPKEADLPGVNDSKKLTPAKREFLAPQIMEQAIAWSVASLSSDEIDRINIHQASLRAMEKAVVTLKSQPEYLLIDGRHPLLVGCPQESLVHGDARSRVIAAASILAKVSRDQWMREIAKQYPQYGFEKHKGYGTLQHREAIRNYGLTPIHRKTFNVS